MGGQRRRRILARLADGEVPEQETLNNRVVIEQAKGMVSERAGLDMEHAFALLRNHARNNNRRLADIAYDVIRGDLLGSALDRLAPANRPEGHVGS